MDLAKAREVLNKLDLPEWVKGRELLEETDHDGDPYLLVWLDVDEEFEYDDYGSKVLDTMDMIQERLYEISRDLWIMVSLRAPVPED